MKRKLKSLCLAACFGFVALDTTAQGVIWNGPLVNFTNVAGSDPFQPASQDQLTGQVWLTRGGSQGIFNSAVEAGYTKFSSPAGTEWALGSLANYSSLTYNNWATCFGGPGVLSSTIVGNSAVLHLINENIYLSITFTSFNSGGGFSYVRSSPTIVPEPSAGALIMAGLLAVVVFGKNSRLRRDC